MTIPETTLADRVRSLANHIYRMDSGSGDATLLYEAANALEQEPLPFHATVSMAETAACAHGITMSKAASIYHTMADEHSKARVLKLFDPQQRLEEANARYLHAQNERDRIADEIAHEQNQPF